MNKRGFFIFIVLLVLVSGYYVFHKPLGGGDAFRLLMIGLQAASALSIIILSGAIGRRLLPPLPLNLPARTAVQAAIGLGLVSLAYLGLGTWWGVRFWLSWLLFSVLLVFLWRDALQWAVQLKQSLQLVLSDASPAWLPGLVGLGLLLAFVKAAAPPLKYDSLVYHLALPERYIAAGRFEFVSENIYWGMPQIAESLFTWLWSMTGAAEAAAIFAWMAGGLALLGLWGFVRQKLGGASGWVAVAVLLAGATQLDGLAWAYSDWFSFLFGLCILIFLDLTSADRSNGERRWLFWAGLSAGLAIGTKYSAGSGLLSAIAVMVLLPKASFHPRRKMAAVLLLSCAALLAAGPWLIRNVLATGNPAYPFIFPTVGMSAQRLALYAGKPAWGGLPDFLFLPFMATLTGREGTPGYGASIGPLLLAFSLFAGWGWTKRAEQERNFLKQMVWFALTGLTIWAIGSRLTHFLIQPRLHFVLFPSFAILAAAGFQNISRFAWPGVRLGRIAEWIITLVLVLNVFRSGMLLIRTGTLDVFFSPAASEQYRTDNLGMYVLAMDAVRELPVGSKVLFLFEPRAYSCGLNCDPDEILDRWSIDAYEKAYDLPAMLANWRTAGYTHVLYHAFGAEYLSGEPGYPARDWLLLAEFEQRMQPMLNLGAIYLLYRIP